MKVIKRLGDKRLDAIETLKRRSQHQRRQFRDALRTPAELIEEMEKKYDHQFQIVFKAIKELLEPVAPPPPRNCKKRAFFWDDLKGPTDLPLLSGRLVKTAVPSIAYLKSRR